MKIHNINLETKINEKLFHLAIGNFDGVHLGHQQIISKLVDKARLNSSLSAILSFNPHPRQFFSRELDRYQILGEETKQKILRDLGVNHYFLLNFDLSISNLSPSDFIKKIIVQQLKVSKLLVGYDFRFGKNRKGNTSTLQDYSVIHGFDLQIIEPIKETSNNEIYSSTAIREAIRIGDMEKANSKLGRTWTMQGKVIHGDKREVWSS